MGALVENNSTNPYRNPGESRSDYRRRSKVQPWWAESPFFHGKHPVMSGTVFTWLVMAVGWTVMGYWQAGAGFVAASALFVLGSHTLDAWDVHTYRRRRAARPCASSSLWLTDSPIHG